MSQQAVDFGEMLKATPHTSLIRDSTARHEIRKPLPRQGLKRKLFAG